MSAEYFTNHAEVQNIIGELKSNKKIYSDVMDEEGNQYEIGRAHV